MPAYEQLTALPFCILTHKQGRNAQGRETYGSPDRLQERQSGLEKAPSTDTEPWAPVSGAYAVRPAPSVRSR
jgi:hypothetical protein